MKNGLRLYFVEKMGLTHLVKGDAIWHDMLGELVIDGSRYTKHIAGRVEVTFFADRKNTGEQPVPDDSPVAIYDEYGTFINKGKANSFFWTTIGKGSINSWKPDYDRLLDMQTLHDRDQPKSVTIETKMYQLPKAKEVEAPRHELKSNVEYYSPVTGYKYKFFDYNLHFFSGAGVWFKSGIEKISSLQLRERVKPVVVGYQFTFLSGKKSGVHNLEEAYRYAERYVLFSINKNGKPLLRPIYKKD